MDPRLTEDDPFCMDASIKNGLHLYPIDAYEWELLVVEATRHSDTYTIQGFIRNTNKVPFNKIFSGRDWNFKYSRGYIVSAVGCSCEICGDDIYFENINGKEVEKKVLDMRRKFGRDGYTEASFWFQWECEVLCYDIFEMFIANLGIQKYQIIFSG